MTRGGMATYDKATNSLIVIRPNESRPRSIRCQNLNPAVEHVFGVQMDGDDIWVMTGLFANRRPTRRILCRFSSLTGGSSRYL